MNGCEHVLLHQLAGPAGEQELPKVMARGPNFIFAKEFILKNHGEKVWERLLNCMPGESRQIWEQNLVAVGEYPLIALKQMVQALSNENHMKRHQEIAEIYEFIADRSLNTLYKVFFSLTNPSYIIANYPHLWQRFFIMDSIKVSEVMKEHAVVEFTMPDIFLDWLPAACYGFSKKAVELAGGFAFEMKLLDKIRLQNELWHIQYEMLWKEKYQSFKLSNQHR